MVPAEVHRDERAEQPAQRQERREDGHRELTRAVAVRAEQVGGAGDEHLQRQRAVELHPRREVELRLVHALQGDLGAAHLEDAPPKLLVRLLAPVDHRREQRQQQQQERHAQPGVGEPVAVRLAVGAVVARQQRVAFDGRVEQRHVEEAGDHDQHDGREDLDGGLAHQAVRREEADQQPEHQLREAVVDVVVPDGLLVGAVCPYDQHHEPVYAVCDRRDDGHGQKDEARARQRAEEAGDRIPQLGQALAEREQRHRKGQARRAVLLLHRLLLD